MRSRSLPARNARTADSPAPNRLMIAPMVRASVTTIPSNPSESRSTPVITLGESVAGSGSSGSKHVSAMCAVMMLVTPASMAARKGTSSRESSLSQHASNTGNWMWESVPVSP